MWAVSRSRPTFCGHRRHGGYTPTMLLFAEGDGNVGDVVVLAVALTLQEKFSNLSDVSDFVSLPAWLAGKDEKLFARLFVTDADAAMPDGTP